MMSCPAVSVPQERPRPAVSGRFGRVGRDAQDLDRHERLPAPARRHPGLPAQHGAAAGPRAAGRVRLHLEARPGGRPRRRPRSTPSSPSRSSGTATTMLLPTPGATRRAVGLLREHGCASVWFGAAAPLGLMAPALRRAGARAAGGHHPRARGGLGAAARRPAAAAPDRRGHGHRHLPGRVHPLADRDRADAGRGRPDGRNCRRGSTRRPSTPAPAARRSGPGSGWPTGPWWCACPGWCRARGRTR